MKRIALSVCLAAVALLVALAPTPSSHGQSSGGSSSTNSGSATNRPVSVFPYWRAELPGGIYMVALSSIASVSIHDYLVDGTLSVTEVVVDTRGTTTCRFYCLNKLTIPTPGGIGQSSMQEGLKQAERLAETATGTTGTTAPWKQVVKNYPTTTHAHTVEFRLNSKEDCEALFNSADEAWRKNETRIYRVR